MVCALHKSHPILAGALLAVVLIALVGNAAWFKYQQHQGTIRSECGISHLGEPVDSLDLITKHRDDATLEHLPADQRRPLPTVKVTVPATVGPDWVCCYSHQDGTIVEYFGYALEPGAWQHGECPSLVPLPDSELYEPKDAE